MKNKFFAVFLFFGLNITSQTTRTFTVEKSVHSIKLYDNASVTIIENNQPNVDLSGTFYDYTENNGILEFRGKSTVTVSCSAGLIKFINCKDKSKLTIHSSVNSDSLSVTLENYARANISMQLKKISVITKDYAHLKFSGHTDIAQIQSSGFSKVNILSSVRARYELSDFANLKICTSGEVEGKSRDFAKVTLSGNPLKVNVETNEFSKISRTIFDCNPISGSELKSAYYNMMNDFEETTQEESSTRKKAKKRRYSWQGISAGVNAILNENNSFSFDKKYDFFEPNYSSSFNFQLNPFQQNFYIYKRSIAFLTGIGIEWRIFALRKKAFIDPDTSFFHGYIDTTPGFTLRKNNLRNFNVQIPFLFDFRFGKKNRFSFMTGMVGTWMLSSSQKLELTNNGYEYEIIKKDQFNLNPLQLKAHVSMGYKDVHFFGEYAFNGMFLKNQGPKFRFLTVGIRYSYDYD